MKRAAALLALAVLAACSRDYDRNRSDWESQNAARLAKEAEDATHRSLPRGPDPAQLVELRLGNPGGFRFYVDAGTLSVADGIVRYALVARSDSGASNVTYEGLNCRSGEYRLYASGRSDGTWVPQEAPWRPAAPRPAQRALMHDYFCPKRVTIASAAEGAMALRRGGHPLADSASAISGPR